VETRLSLTLDEFRAATNEVGRDGLTSLGLILKPFIESNDREWDRWESKTFRRLTRAQRALVIWSTLARTSCNAAEHAYAYFENRVDAAHCGEVFSAIKSFDWPELTERFIRLFANCIGDPDRPKAAYEQWRKRERDERKKMHADIRKIALQRTGQIVRDEHALDMFALHLADAGELTLPERNFDAAEDFAAWLKSPEVRNESVVRIRSWMWKHQGELCILRPG